MQQYTVPQFIDVEDKIFGPITVRQFVIILGGAIFIAICYKIFDFSLFITLAVITLALCGTFAFAKVNGRPFHFFILNLIQTLKKPNLRIWNNAADKKKEEEKDEIKIEIKQEAPVKRYTASRLAELSLVIDTGGAYRGDE